MHLLAMLSMIFFREYNSNSFAFEIIIDCNFKFYFLYFNQCIVWLDLQGFESP